MRAPSMWLFVIVLCAVSASVACAQPDDSPFTAADFQRHVEFLADDNLAGRAPGSEGSALAAQYIIERLRKAGCSPLLEDGAWLQEFPLDAPDQSTGALFGQNILAVRPGRGKLAEEAVIVSAHYDHLPNNPRAEGQGDAVFNGADDNASGVAALLLIAEALNDEADQFGDSCRTVVFASFDAEEKGLRGAKHYVQRPAWPLDKTSAMINFDCVGRLRLGKVFVFDVETNQLLAQAVRDAAQTRKLSAETRLGSHGRSDHVEFLAHGIPSMHFFTGTHADYHQVSDEADRVNHEGGAAVAGIACDVLQQAMTHPGSLEFKSLNPVYDIKLILKVMTSLGIVPNVAAQGGRYPEILLVQPDSPAARHGLESGDQITAIDGVRLERVEDALPLFQQATLLEGLRLTVLRESGEREIELPPEIFSALTGPRATPLGDGKFAVNFKYQAEPQVKVVNLAGEFNDWNPTDLRMEGPDAKGQFTIRVTLEPGIYQYKFVVEGDEWIADPENIHHTGADDNSVLWVGRLGQ